MNFPFSVKKIAFCALFVVFGTLLSAQTDCKYTLTLRDSTLAGWGDHSITIAGQTFTLAAGKIAATSEITVKTGDALVVNFNLAPKRGNLYYSLYNASGKEIFKDGAFPESGKVFQTTAVCPVCPALPTSRVTLVQRGNDFVVLGLPVTTPPSRYNIEYGAAGFKAGTGIFLKNQPALDTIKGLNAGIDYDFYMTTVCPTSGVIGFSTSAQNVVPFTAQTTPKKPISSCNTHQLTLYDKAKNGWNGGAVLVKSDGVISVHTLTQNVDSLVIPLTAAANRSLELFYITGEDASENRFTLSDVSGKKVLFDSKFNPKSGKKLSTIACPTCPAPMNIAINERGEDADITWAKNDSAGVYVVEYGMRNFKVGTGKIISTTATKATMTDLKERKNYEVYVKFICKKDTSAAFGPILFTTRWNHDVGITAINAPVTNCNINATDSVFVSLTNFGGKPQTLVKYWYSVNDVPAPISYPQDGLYTNVVGKDSTAVIPFETTTNFSLPGEYLIKAWTELKKDSLLTNDTISMKILSLPVIRQFPYIANFEENHNFWYVGAGSTNATWAWGAPKGEVITAAVSGKNAWVTNLTGRYNRNEKSYLNSPCFDFSGTATDPVLSFSLFLNNDTGDYAWVETSKDGGKTWKKLAPDGASRNFYNNRTLNVWEGNGGTAGWFTVKTTLLEGAKSKDYRLRIAFASDKKNSKEGAAIDNIQINLPASGCALAADIKVTVKNATTSDSKDGSLTLTITGGNEPYKYAWVSGESTATLANLKTGNYCATVTDKNNCSEIVCGAVKSATEITSAKDILDITELKLFPNPATDQATLQLTFSQPTDFQVDVLNVVGQTLSTRHFTRTQAISENFDMAQYAKGLYFLRIKTKAALWVEKLVVK
jgi:Secretion system C-terminal sorting domain/SprB repeat